MTTVNKLNICLKNLLIETIPKSLQNLNISYILKMSNFKLQLSFGHKTVGAPPKKIHLSCFGEEEQTSENLQF